MAPKRLAALLLGCSARCGGERLTPLDLVHSGVFPTGIANPTAPMQVIAAPAGFEVSSPLHRPEPLKEGIFKALDLEGSAAGEVTGSDLLSKPTLAQAPDYDAEVAAVDAGAARRRLRLFGGGERKPVYRRYKRVSCPHRLTPRKARPFQGAWHSDEGPDQWKFRFQASKEAPLTLVATHSGDTYTIKEWNGLCSSSEDMRGIIGQAEAPGSKKKGPTAFMFEVDHDATPPVLKAPRSGPELGRRPLHRPAGGLRPDEGLGAAGRGPGGEAEAAVGRGGGGAPSKPSSWPPAAAAAAAAALGAEPVSDRAPGSKKKGPTAFMFEVDHDATPPVLKARIRFTGTSSDGLLPSSVETVTARLAP